MKLLIALLAVSAFAQDATAPGTQPRASQIKEPVVAAPSLKLLIPGALPIYVRLDPDVFTLDTSTNPPTLRIKMQAQAAPVPFIYPLTRNADMSFTMPTALGRYVSIHRNGVLQLPIVDYDIVGSTLKFRSNDCCEADENITAQVYP